MAHPAVYVLSKCKVQLIPPHNFEGSHQMIYITCAPSTHLVHSGD